MAAIPRIAFEHLHAAIRVRDLDASIEFYHAALGLTVQRSLGDPQHPSSVFLPGIQLIRADGQDTANKGVLDHIGLAFANLDDALAQLAAAGIPLETPVADLTQQVGRPLRTAYFRDNEGNKIEILELGPQR